MNDYKLPTQPDVMPTDTIGYDQQAAAFTFNGQPIRREGITDGTWKFEGHEFVWVTETRTIAQIVAELKGVIVEEPEMCPFCPIFESPDVQPQPIGNDFFGEPASIGGIASCGICHAVISGLSDKDQAWYVEQAKHGQEVQE